MKKQRENIHFRYPGVAPFTTEQSHIFFGRTKESKRLSKLIHQEPIVVLHGKSGLGKSSLINAGLVPLLSENTSYSPIIIRFGAWTKIRTSSPINITKRALSYQGETSSTILNFLLPNDTSLWSYAKNRQILHSEKPILIFDQFEELFSYPDSEIYNFKQEISELMNTGIPLRFTGGRYYRRTRRIP
jgi:energy-coupling factor transporter ATP-binding protein EcfA2